MTPTQLLRTLTRLGLVEPGRTRPGLCVAKAAKALRVNERTIRRWIKGQTAIPGTVEELLLHLRRHSI